MVRTRIQLEHPYELHELQNGDRLHQLPVYPAQEQQGEQRKKPTLNWPLPIPLAEIDLPPIQKQAPGPSSGNC